MEELFERAKKFLIDAEDDFNKGFYDLCVFHLEQSIELLLKYILAKKIGYFSKTHSLIILSEEVKKIQPEFGKFLEDNKRYLIDLERSYVGARYLPFRYEKEEAQELLKFVKDIFNKYERR